MDSEGLCPSPMHKKSASTSDGAATPRTGKAAGHDVLTPLLAQDPPEREDDNLPMRLARTTNPMSVLMSPTKTTSSIFAHVQKIRCHRRIYRVMTGVGKKLASAFAMS